MEKRIAKNYIEILREIVRIVDVRPDTIISDFEKAERKALQSVFPNAKFIGCFFHYSQVLKTTITHNNKHEVYIYFLLMSVSQYRH